MMRFHRPRPLATRPTVSVVIPCYNYGHYLPDAVAGALDQEGVDVDVLVVDDASTDDSAEVALRLARGDHRVDVLLHEENRGHIRTYNDGLAKARGDYVTLVSADDVLPRDALTRAVALMEAHPSVGLVYGFPRNFEAVPPTELGRVRSWSVWDGPAWLRRAYRTGRNSIMSAEVVMRRAAWDLAGPYDERLPHAADLALWLRTALQCDIGRVNGPAQAYYRVHGGNMHLTRFAGMLVDLEQRRLTFDLVLANRADVRESARQLERAHRALAREALRIAGEPTLTGPERHELVAFASRTSPGLRATGLREPGPVAARAARAYVRVARALAWHLWRRYGL